MQKSKFLSWLTTKSFRTIFSLLLCVMVAAATFNMNSKRASAVCSTTLTWTGTDAATNNGWSDANNWGGCAIANGDELDFPTGLSGVQLTSNNDTSHSGFSLHFIGSNFIITSTTQIYLGGSSDLIVFDPGATTDTVNASLVLPVLGGSVNFVLPSSSNILNLGGNIDLNGDNLVFNNNGITNVTGVISDSPTGGSITMGGSGGSLSFSGANTYPGATILNQGSFAAESSTALGNGGTVTVASSATLNIGLPASTFTIANPITLNSSHVLNLFGTNTLTGNITLGGDSQIQANASTSLTIQGAINNPHKITAVGPGTLVFSGANNYSDTEVVSGVLVAESNNALGTGTVSVDNGATLALSGTVTIPASQTLNLSGTLSANSAHGIWSGPVNITNVSGGVTFDSSSRLDVNGVISGTGNINITGSGGGEVHFVGANTYVGTTTVENNAQLGLDNSSALGNTDGTAATEATVQTGGQLGLNNLIIANDLLILNGAGHAPILAAFGGSGTSGWTGNIVLASPTTIGLGPSATLTLSGNISGPGDFTIGIPSSTGTVVLSGTNTYSGSTTVASGIVNLSSGAAIPSTTALTVDTGATVNLPASGSVTVGSLTGAGNVNLAGATLTTGDSTSTTFSGNMTGVGGGLTKTGTGTFTLTGSTNSYTGATQVSGGVLEVGNSSALGSTSGVSVVSGAQLLLDNGITVSGVPLTLNGDGPSAGAGALALHCTASSQTSTWDDTITLNTASTLSADFDPTCLLHLGQVISGTGPLTKTGAGELGLFAANTYSGATMVSAGILKVNPSAIYNVIPSGSAVTVASGATLDLSNSLADTIGSLTGAGSANLGGANLTTGGDSTSTTFSGVLSGSGGGLTKLGSGTFTLTGTNTYTGPTTVNSGTLLVNGTQAGSAVTVNAGATIGGTGTTGDLTIESTGTLSPGVSGPGTLTTGNLTLSPSSQFNEDIQGTSPGANYDQVAVNGTAALNGNLNIADTVLLPTGSKVILITSSGPLSGTFSSNPTLATFTTPEKNSFQNIYKSNDMELDWFVLQLPPGSGGGGGGSLLQINQGPGSGNPQPAVTSPPLSPSAPETTGTQQVLPSSQLHGAAPTTSSPQITSFFTDIAGNWAEQDIDQIFTNCKVSGYQDAQGNFLRVFRPDNNLTRAELMTMLIKCKVGVLPPLTTAPFSDVPANHWAAPYIAEGVQLGLVQGYSDHTFKPNQTISRAEALKIILLAWFTTDDINSSPQNSSCTDLTGSAWYVQFFYFALNRGFLGGAQGPNSALCRPDSMITRAESASSIVKIQEQPVAFSPSNLAMRVTLLQPVSRFAAGSGAASGSVKTDLVLHGVRRPHFVKRKVS